MADVTLKFGSPQIIFMDFYTKVDTFTIINNFKENVSKLIFLSRIKEVNSKPLL